MKEAHKESIAKMNLEELLLIVNKRDTKIISWIDDLTKI